MYDSETTCKKVIEKIQHLCESKGISRYSLAKKAGLASATVYDMMDGKTRPQLCTLLDICNVLEVSIADIVEEIHRNCNDNDTEAEKQILYSYKMLSEQKRTYVEIYIDMLQQYKPM